MMHVRALRALFAHLQEFQALSEAHGIDTIVGPDGDKYNLFDMQALFGKRFMLPRAQAAAIELACYDDLEGFYIATALGTGDPEQVERDAQAGLRTLCELYNGCLYEEDEDEKNEVILERISEGTFLGEDDEAFVWSVPGAGG